MTRLFAAEALLETGWARDVLIEIDGAGNIAAITPRANPGNAPRAAGPVIPGMADLHSHAFQRAMAGLAEGAGADNFWTWRELMYGFLAHLTPDDLHAIAAQLCVELLKQGYTCLGEFHYLHNAPDGAPYEDRAEMSVQVIEAARAAGIAITHLPVLYAFGGFGAAPMEDRQRRFAAGADAVLAIVDSLRHRYADDPDVGVGLAPHSLRAVAPALLAEAVAALHGGDPHAPVHIHIAEQTREVEECVDWSGARPVEWLLDNAGVDGRWCLVHATHMEGAETRRLAASGAVAGLCPTTEANLGDGFFPLADSLAAGGRFGVGSDANVSVSPVEELRWLEYGQRLTHRRRGVAATGDGPSIGATLWRAAAEGGARALARPAGALARGRRADLVVLDGGHVNLADRHGDAILDALVFAGNDCLVADVMVGGRWVITDGRHRREDAIASAYRGVLARRHASA
ncbi:MAG: formimidoylglutamate deiminase [Alphaproteobacteria bacterium]